MNDFFNHHKGLGSMFDSNRNGSLDGREFGPMAAFGGMYANEISKASRKVDRELDDDWDDDDEDDDSDRDSEDWNWFDDDDDEDDEDDDFDDDEDGFDDDDVNTHSRSAVMQAIRSGSTDYTAEFLVEEALDNGVRFTPDDIIFLSYGIWDQEVLVRLIATSKPRFLQEHADELAPRWGPVELEYQEEAFDHEFKDGNVYHVNTPEEDW